MCPSIRFRAEPTCPTSVRGSVSALADPLGERDLALRELQLGDPGRRRRDPPERAQGDPHHERAGDGRDGEGAERHEREDQHEVARGRR